MKTKNSALAIMAIILITLACSQSPSVTSAPTIDIPKAIASTQTAIAQTTRQASSPTPGIIYPTTTPTAGMPNLLHIVVQGNKLSLWVDKPVTGIAYQVKVLGSDAVCGTGTLVSNETCTIPFEGATLFILEEEITLKPMNIWYALGD